MSAPRFDGGRGGDMSLLDYFAAHAPVQVPDWFRHPDAFPVPPMLGCLEACEADENCARLTPLQRAVLETWLDGERVEYLPPDLAAIGQAIDERYLKNALDVEQARTANAAARWFAWRWHYAATMLKAREA